MLTYRCATHGAVATVDPQARRVRLEPPTPTPGLKHFPQCALALLAARAMDDPEAPVGQHGPASRSQCAITREGA